MTANQPPTGGSRSSVNDRIVEATLQLIAEQGLGDMTMLEIAENAGVARQTLYNHYPDVDSIVVTAVARHNQESIQLLDASLRVVDRPEDKLKQIVRHTVAIGAHGHHATGFEYGLGPDARVVVRGYDAALAERIHEILEEGQQTGAFRTDLDPNIDALLIRHILIGLAEQAATTSDPAGLAETGARTVLAAVTRR